MQHISLKLSMLNDLHVTKAVSNSLLNDLKALTEAEGGEWLEEYLVEIAVNCQQTSVGYLDMVGEKTNIL